ncbi:hypothetical protein H310_01973 [Aphanomyces invadans]|uniref:Uncharacterized protein n=1 Tax=Aphanomyces invadans TaxID=157072 RepID=A0A024UM06_9STRA|nr:hypothetical protein H310_01973 [Aphanomyces invadans]ETW07461.1 hypothetical protein H310_01973 [Aphanomyces invadans]|eukprot:XP_008863554.1 hypothetical protein H310_01973 [Aphanomyces invadans]
MDTARAATAMADKAARYACLKQLYEALQDDHVDLARRYTAVKQKISYVSSENECLVDELCRYTESDFDSDSDGTSTPKQTSNLKVEKAESSDGVYTRTPTAVVKAESASVDT